MHDLTRDYPAIRDALRDAIVEHCDDILDRYGIGTEDDVHAVSAQSYDGFIAYTNGGFRTLVPSSLSDAMCEPMGDFEQSILSSYIETACDDAAEAYIDANGYADAYAAYCTEDAGDLKANAWLHQRWDDREAEYAAHYFDPNAPELPGIETAPPFSMDGEREAYWCFESEYMAEGGTYFYEITALFYEKGHRRNITGEDEVYIFAGINTDFEYGRECGLESCVAKTYKLARLTPARVNVIIENFVRRIVK